MSGVVITVWENEIPHVYVLGHFGSWKYPLSPLSLSIRVGVPARVAAAAGFAPGCPWRAGALLPRRGAAAGG